MPFEITPAPLDVDIKFALGVVTFASKILAVVTLSSKILAVVTASPASLAVVTARSAIEEVPTEPAGGVTV